MSKRLGKTIVTLVCLALVFSIVSPAALADEAPIVKAIVIRGNENIDTDVIRSAIIKTQIDQSAVDQEILDDLRSIYDTGYFQDASATFEPAVGGVTVVFNVVENPVVQDIIFKGTTSIPLNDFAQLMKVQPGNVLNALDLLEDLHDLREWAFSEYGLLIRVSNLEADTNGLILVELAEARIKDIKIEGNEKTKDFVIRRELTFEPGDVVNMQQIDNSLRRVLMLGFFDEISRDLSEEEDPDETVLTINVKERKTGSATFGVAYSSTDGIVGFVEAADDNFLGRGQRLNATLQLGKGLQSYELGFYEPYIEEGGTSLGVNVYKRNSDVKKSVKTEEDPNAESLTGKRHTMGGDLTLGRPFTEFTRGRLTFKAENNKYVLDGEGDATDPRWYDDYDNRTIGFGINTNTTDHPFNPTEGYKNDVYLEVGTRLLGGDSQYAKLRMEHSRYYEVGDRGYVFAFRGIGGRLLAGNLLENEQFMIGGADTIRGYTRGSNDSLKGDQMLVVNAEFRFPIVDKITGVVFTDWGRTWDKDDTIGLAELNNSYGLGVRLDTPLGLLRLDYGFGKDTEGSRKGQFYFGIGQTF
ncbi:MAG: BamA/TamA family outer membrane protein [Firmicutes bacterium]|nr:BamA/TamA family outer membrane protein [Bacillota bacterium]